MYISKMGTLHYTYGKGQKGMVTGTRVIFPRHLGDITVTEAEGVFEEIGIGAGSTLCMPGEAPFVDYSGPKTVLNFGPHRNPIPPWFGKKRR